MMNSSELEQATEALGRLFCSFPQGPADIEPFIVAYLEIVRDQALPDILAAIERLRRGECPNVDPAFCPTAAQVYREVNLHKSVREASARRAAGTIVPLLPAGHFQNQSAGRRKH